MVTLSKVTLCLIVKNEVENIERVLAQRNLFDKVLVVDTGSTDGTQDLCRELGCEVVDFQWIDDFAAARNVWFETVKDGWILWLDADDEISYSAAVESLALAADAEKDVFGFAYDYEYPNGYVCDHIRLFRADVQIRWKGRIHEHLDFRKSGYGRLLRAGCSIQHVGYPMHDEEALERKSERNNALLKLELEDDPKNAIIYQYIAMDHQAHGRHGLAVEWFGKCLVHAKSDRDFTWLPELYVNCSRSYMKLGKEKEARKCIADGMKLYPKIMPTFIQRHLDMRRADGVRAEDIGRSRSDLLRALS